MLTPRDLESRFRIETVRFWASWIGGSTNDTDKVLNTNSRKMNGKKKVFFFDWGYGVFSLLCLFV